MDNSHSLLVHISPCPLGVPVFLPTTLEGSEGSIELTVVIPNPTGLTARFLLRSCVGATGLSFRVSITTPKALVLTFGPLQFDSRVQRQVRTLSEHFSVTLVAPGVDRPGWWDEVSQLVDMNELRSGLLDRMAGSGIVRMVMGVILFFGLYRPFYWSPRYSPYWARRVISELGEDVDVVVVNDVDPLPLAFSLFTDVPIVADVHEFAPGQDAQDTLHQRSMSRYWSWICREYLPRCRAVTVVSESVRDLYLNYFDVDSAVVRSTPDFVDINPSEVAGGEIQFVHHGFYSPRRGIELLIKGFSHAHHIGVLNLVLQDAPVRDLQNLASTLGIPPGRIVFHEFVPTDKLVSFLNAFDVEVIFIPTDIENGHAALPNKFFEAIHARLGVVSGPSAEIVRVVNEHGVGDIVPSFDPSDLGNVLRAVTPDKVGKWKSASEKLARELNWQREAPDYRDYLSHRA